MTRYTGNYPTTTAQWREELAAGRAIHQPAMHAGFAGDKAALEKLLHLLAAESALPGNAHWREILQRGSSERFKRNESGPEGSFSTLCMSFTPCDLQIAVGLALAHEPEAGEAQLRSLDSWSMLDLYWNLEDRASMAVPRQTWNAQDETLLQSAIALWCPVAITRQTPLAGKDSLEQTQAARLMALVGRYAGNSEAVEAFGRAGLDMQFFFHWTVSLEDITKLKVSNVWRKDTQGQIPLVVAMAAQGSLGAAASLYSSSTSPAMKNTAQQVIEDIVAYSLPASRPENRPGGFSERLFSMARSKPWLRAPRAVQDIADFADALMQAQPGLLAQAAQMALVSQFMNNRRVEEDLQTESLVQTMLALPGHGGRPPLATTLANWRQERGQASLALAAGEHKPTLDIGALDEWLDSVMTRLMSAALSHHSQTLLQALTPAFRASADGLLGMSPSRLLLEALSLDDDRAMVLEELVASLEFIRSCGVTHLQEVRVSEVQAHDGSNVLHWVAKFPQDNKFVALLAALQAGFDPALKDAHDRTPADLLADPTARARWELIEKSFAARALAQQALQEISLKGEVAPDGGRAPMHSSSHNKGLSP